MHLEPIRSAEKQICKEKDFMAQDMRTSLIP